jgi:hypothetical protein
MRIDARLSAPLLALSLLALPVRSQTPGVTPTPGVQPPSSIPGAAAPVGPAAASQQSASPGPYGRRPYRETLEQRFSAANTAHDGKLTLDQAKAGLPYAARHFSDIDKDHHGYVTVKEIRAFAAARRLAYRPNP